MGGKNSLFLWRIEISILLLLIFLSKGNVIAGSTEAADPIDYLKSLSFEDLLLTEITSVSKKPEKLFDATAAVFVISSEDIKRTGARSIPEALRMVPGLQVANISANKYSISARGFADLFANKLLVIIDGRSVYSPLFSGVFWELQDTVMEDIDRIEVIRGPGATLWGANAVNGVINIITKSAEDTQGALVTAGTGSTEPYIAAARYGGKISENGHFRLFVKGQKHSGNEQPNGKEGYDGWSNLRSGFKADIDITDRDEITLQGDVVKGEEEVTLRFPGVLFGEQAKDDIDYKEANLLARWVSRTGDGTVVSLQAYYDYSKIEAFIPQDNRHTFDVDFQYKTSSLQRNEIIWGLGYRVTSDDIKGSQLVTFTPESKEDQLYSAFIQDEIAIVDDVFWITLGSKFEYNDYSDFEIQPNIRARWKPEENQTFWAAVSRSMRTPARADHDIRSITGAGLDPYGNNYVSVILGNENFDSEELIAYEAGYRYQPSQTLSFDTAVFFNTYDGLRSLDYGVPFPAEEGGSPYLIYPVNINNNIDAETYGFEFLTSWQPFDIWKLAFSYAYFAASFDFENGAVPQNQQFNEGDFPEHQLQLRSYLDLPFSLSFNSELYYVDELKDRNIDSYFRLDLMLAWQATDHIDISISGENLLSSRQMEFGSSNSVIATEVPRRYFVNLTWRY